MLSILGNGGSNRYLQQADLATSRSLARLSSGLRIVHTADDAAGQEIQENMGAKVRGAHQAVANIQEALAFLKVAEDGISGVLDVFQHMRELTVQGGNGSLATADRTAITKELQSLGLAVIDAQQVAYAARVNYQSPPGQRKVTYQVGSDYGQTMTFDFNPLAATLTTFIATFPAMSVATTVKADTARTNIDKAISGTVAELSKLGGFVNTLEHQLDDVSNLEITQARSQSQIRDVDMAQELTSFVRDQVMGRTALAATKIHNLRYGSLAKLIYAA